MKPLIVSLLCAKTTRRRCWAAAVLAVVALLSASCRSSAPAAEAGHEEEAMARTEFTSRIENFFEYAPLKAGKPSQFLIHLTDLTDGAPVAKAEVVLKIKPKNAHAGNEVKAKVGRVTGIYVAEVEIAERGVFDIEFTVKNEKLNETMSLSDFVVE